ncbi:MAG: hypothetical protein CG446_589, partial [Methanosaeta sp. ASO1]
ILMTSHLARKCLKRSTHQLGNTQSVQQIRTRLVSLQQVRKDLASNLIPRVNK